MAKQPLQLADIPQLASPHAWVEHVLANFDDFLSDHASCEKKASGMAMNVAAHYPDQPELLSRMADLAVEELNHYREVIKLLLDRGITPKADQKDPYVHALNQLIRRGTENFLLDRLLIGAVIERRGAERFALVAKHITSPDLKKFYRAIASSEERHWVSFVELASSHCDPTLVLPRLQALSTQENEIMLAQPIRAALH